MEHTFSTNKLRVWSDMLCHNDIQYTEFEDIAWCSQKTCHPFMASQNIEREERLSLSFNEV